MWYTRLHGNVPPDKLGVVLPMGCVVVLLITGGIPVMDEAVTLNSPSFPSLAACRSTESTHVSETTDVNCTARSTIGHLQDIQTATSHYTVSEVNS